MTATTTATLLAGLFDAPAMPATPEREDNFTAARAPAPAQCLVEIYSPYRERPQTMTIESLVHSFSAGCALAVTGTRRWTGPLPEHARQLIAAVPSILVGDATGADARVIEQWRGAAEPLSRRLVIFALPSRVRPAPSPVAATVYTVARISDALAQPAFRSQMMIATLRRFHQNTAHPVALLALPAATPPPAGLRADPWPSLSSGTWSTVANAAYRKIPILAYTPHCPPALAGIPWQPVAVPGPGPDELAHLWRPAPSLLEEPFDFQLCAR